MFRCLVNPRNWKSRFNDFRVTRESNARARQTAKEARKEAAELERRIKVNEANDEYLNRGCLRQALLRQSGVRESVSL